MKNFYPELVCAAKSLAATEVLDEDDPSDEAIASFLGLNRQVFATAREALESPCFVQLEYSQEFWERHWDDTQRLRNLALAFRFGGNAAQAAGRWSDTANYGVALISLGNAIRRGGIIVDMLVSVAIAGLGVDQLRHIRHRLTANEAGRLSRRSCDSSSSARRSQRLPLAMWNGNSGCLGRASRSISTPVTTAGCRSARKKGRQSLPW